VECAQHYHRRVVVDPGAATAGAGVSGSSTRRRLAASM
jgi:hypothetical protein